MNENNTARKDSFYQKCKPSLDELFESFKKSKKNRQKILSMIDAFIEVEDMPIVKDFLVKLRASLLNSEVVK